MKQNERDKFAARLFKNRQKKQLKVLNYNQSKAKKTLVCENQSKKSEQLLFFLLSTRYIYSLKGCAAK